MALNEHSFGDNSYQAMNQNHTNASENSDSNSESIASSLSDPCGISSSITNLGSVDTLSIEKPLEGQLLDVAIEPTKQYDLKFGMEEGKNVARNSAEDHEEMTVTFDNGGQIKFQTATDLIENAMNNENSGAHSIDEAGQSKFLSAMELIEELIARMKFLEDQNNQEGESPIIEEQLAMVESDLAEQLSNLEPASGDESTDAPIELTSSEESYAKLDSMPAVFKQKPPQAQEQEAQQPQTPQENDQMAQNVAEQLAAVEPAAGEGSSSSGGASGGGFGFQSSFKAQGVIPIDDVGPIDPTQLEYGIEFKEEQLLGDEEEKSEDPETPPSNDIPEIFSSAKVLDETDGFDLSASGNLTHDFGDDGAGQIVTTGVFTPSGSMADGFLQSNGAQVLIAPTANGYEGTANGQTVFTLTIDAQTGDYIYNQKLPLDHADGTDPNDAILLDFGVQIIDSNGDSAQTTISVTILDDAPISISAKRAFVDETDLAPDTSVSGQIDANFGNDGAGEIGGNGTAPTGLTSGNDPVLIGFDTTTNTYTGTANGQTIFTLNIEPNGQYTFILSGTLDHPNTNDPNDYLALDFGIKATDFDGDSIDGTLTIKVRDDGPVAEDDCVNFDTVSGVAKGNVLDNDALSMDQDNTVTEISFNGGKVTVDPVNGATIGGEFGLLTISSDGTYEYTLLDPSGTGGSSSSSALNPTSSDVIGVQESLSRDGITVSVANDGDFDLTWVNTADGSGLGIDNLNSGDSTKVWPKGETFDIDFAQNAHSVTLTIAEIGSNNNYGEHGVDFIVTLADGSTVNGEQQFVPGQINNGTFSFTLDASDFGGQEITSIALNSTNDGNYKGASFLLNNVEATYENNVDICDEFVYTLTDGDGDSSTATLKFKGIEAKLIVGENVDDTDKSNTPHHIGGDEGTITGEAGSDILIGDVGGTNTEQPSQDYNFVFILDVSGSMGEKTSSGVTKIDLLKAAVKNTLNDLDGYQSGNVKVHFSPFSTDTKTAGTFDLSSPNGLQDAINYIDALSANGYTNYEAPMQEAINWLQGAEPIGGDAITTTYFVSDGEPNRYLNDAGNPTSGNASQVINEITGSDGTNEVEQLRNLSNDVIGVGIDIDSAISRLNVIDADGTSINVQDPSDLSAVLKALNPIYKLASVGDDEIYGSDGNDIIYGDSVNSDALADAHGLTTPDGNGWDTFDRLENGESTTDPNWSRDDTTDYIRNNLDELAEESEDDQGEGRQGGGDTIYGGAGDDIIYGQEGDDVIYGGEGNDILSGGSGADQFMMDALNRNVDVIRDFSSDEGDVLDLAGLIQGFDPAQKAINDFVFAREESGGTILSIDVSGSGDQTNAVDFVALEGLQNLDLQALVESGNINMM